MGNERCSKLWSRFAPPTVEHIPQISDAQNEIRVRAIGIDGQSSLEISDGFLFLPETSTGHSAVGNGHHVFGVKFDGLVKILECAS